MSKILKEAEVGVAPGISKMLISSKKIIVHIANFELQFSKFSKLFTKTNVFCMKMQKSRFCCT